MRPSTVRLRRAAATGVLLLAACSRPSAADLSPEVIIQRSADSMQSLSGFSFLIDRQGASAYLDPQGSLSFRRAEGRFVAPNAAAAEVRIIGPGVVVEVQVISIGDRQWETHPLSGEWQEVPTGAGLNPAALLDPSAGLSQVLLSELGDTQLADMAEIEQLPGRPLYHLTGQLQDSSLDQLSFGLIADPQPSIELWIEPQTFYLHRLRIVERPGAGELERSWTIDFWDFGQAEPIQPPVR